MKLKKVLSGFVSAAIAVTTLAVTPAVANAADAPDTSGWQVVLLGFNTGWSGWSGTNSTAGVLEHSATVQEIMDANKITDLSNFGGCALQVWGANIGDEIIYTLTVEDASGEVKFEKVDQLHTFGDKKDDDGNTVVDPAVFQINPGNVTYAATDKITGSVKVSDGSVEKPKPGIVMEIDQAEYTLDANTWTNGDGSKGENWQATIDLESTGDLTKVTKVSDLPNLIQVSFIVADCSADPSALTYKLSINCSTDSDQWPWINPTGDVTKDDETGMITILANFEDDIKSHSNYDFNALRLVISADKSASEDPITLTIGEKTDIAVTGVTLDEETLALKKGESATLTATVAPEGADDGITWTTSNNKVATVAPDGKVTAVASGTATITATSTADETKKAECEVTVTNPATDIAIDETASILVGAEKTLTVTTTPEDADELTYTWTSSDTTVATVANGTVTGVAAGTATITVKAGALEDTCTVTVTAETKPATKVTLNKTSLTLEEEKTETLTATITPADSTDSITWTSSAPAVATVDQTGKVTAVAEGTATITAKANDEISATCAVTVNAKAPEIETKAYMLNVVDASKWGEAGVTQAAQTNIKVTTLEGFTIGTTTYGDVKNKTLKLEGLGFGSCSAVGVTAENVDVAIYLQFGSNWTWCAKNGTLADSSIEYDLSTITGVKDTDVLQEIGFQFNIKGNVGGINDMASTAKVTLNAAEPTFTVVGEEPSSYETGNVETVTDYVPTTPGTQLVVKSITAAEAANTESYTITVTDSNGKTTSVTTNDCYKAFKYNTASGERTETAANGFFIIVKVTGVPEGTTVSVTIEATE